jgi:diacylglycerol kinase (ATP)
MRKRLFIITNPTAGIPRHRFFVAVLERLKAYGVVVTVIASLTREDAPTVMSAACRTNDAIVAAGGDGTFRQAAAVLAGLGIGDMPIGLIPLGTGNVLAHELGLRRTADAVADMLIFGTERIVYGALANDEPFYLMAGVGFDGHVIATLSQRLKRLTGQAAYAPAVLSVLQRPVDDLAIEIDGAHHTANWLIAANGRYYGGRFVAAPTASIFSPGLKAVLVRAANRRQLVMRLVQLGSGQAGVCEGVDIVDARRIVVTSGKAVARQSVACQIDGDGFGTTPLVIDANGPQVRVIVPR